MHTAQGSKLGLEPCAGFGCLKKQLIREPVKSSEKVLAGLQGN